MVIDFQNSSVSATSVKTPTNHKTWGTSAFQWMVAVLVVVVNKGAEGYEMVGREGFPIVVSFPARVVLLVLVGL